MRGTAVETDARFARNNPCETTILRILLFSPARPSRRAGFFVVVLALPASSAPLSPCNSRCARLSCRVAWGGAPLRRLNASRGLLRPLTSPLQERYLRGIRREQGEDKMKTGKTLPDLEAELKRQCGMKRDFLAPARLLHVRSNGHTDLAWKAATAVSPQRQRPRQIAAVRGHPAELLRVPARPHRDPARSRARCRPSLPVHGRGAGRAAAAACRGQPALRRGREPPAARARRDEKRLIRTLDGNARALLSASLQHRPGQLGRVRGGRAGHPRQRAVARRTWYPARSRTRACTSKSSARA